MIDCSRALFLLSEVNLHADPAIPSLCVSFIKKKKKKEKCACLLSSTQVSTLLRHKSNKKCEFSHETEMVKCLL